MVGVLAALLLPAGPALGSGGNASRARCQRPLTHTLLVDVRTRGLSCAQGLRVMRSFENNRVYRTPLYRRVVDLRPYGRHSAPFAIATPLGAFRCVFFAYGLGGSEHVMHCRQGAKVVCWTTA